MANLKGLQQSFVEKPHWAIQVSYAGQKKTLLMSTLKEERKERDFQNQTLRLEALEPV